MTAVVYVLLSGILILQNILPAQTTKSSTTPYRSRKIPIHYQYERFMKDHRPQKHSSTKKISKSRSYVLANRLSRARLPDFSDLLELGYKKSPEGWFEQPENITVVPSRAEVSWYGNSYIPHRYRCQTAGFCSAGAIAGEPVEELHLTTPLSTYSTQPCILARWNFELPFTELPNMVAGGLATDLISGDTLPEKSRFLLEILQASLEKYMAPESSGDIFLLPIDFDFDLCKVRRPLEPLIKSLYSLINLFSSREKGNQMLSALAKASKACMDKDGEHFPIKLLPCLDFSMGSEQAMLLMHPRSLFGNQELCRRFLKYNLTQCLSAEAHSCNQEHLIVLNNFARRFYQCVVLLGTSQNDAHSADAMLPTETLIEYDQTVDSSIGDCVRLHFRSVNLLMLLYVYIYVV